jgi:hypothetical protein
MCVCLLWLVVSFFQKKNFTRVCVCARKARRTRAFRAKVFVFGFRCLLGKKEDWSVKDGTTFMIAIELEIKFLSLQGLFSRWRAHIERALGLSNNNNHKSSLVSIVLQSE